MARQRQYWVVSPNVGGKGKNMEEWKKETLRAHVAIMGYDNRHQTGRRFANRVQLGDIILIARGKNSADMVGLGVVKGECKPDHFPWYDEDVYLRDLEHFEQCERAPESVPILKVLQHTMALVQLHPEKNPDANNVCKWMDKQLGKGGKEDSNEGTTSKTTKVRSTDITKTDLSESTLGYEVKKKAEVTMARKVEAKLLWDYKCWLEKRGHKLVALKYNRLQCDGWEEESQNLIEAKGSISREDIRMAVGQLFDYAFQGRESFNNPNMAILLPDKPDPDSVEWLAPLGIKIIWREGRSFRDNANGQFTAK